MGNSNKSGGSGRPKYHTVKTGPNSWGNKLEGSDTVLSQHRTQAAAIEAARQRAMAHPAASVIVHRPNGQFRDEFSYGSDPYPPKG